jgi:uncharacterized protein YhfF
MFSLDEFNRAHGHHYPLLTAPPKVQDEDALSAALGVTKSSKAWETGHYFAILDIQGQPRQIIRLLHNKKLKACGIFVELREYLKTLPDPFEGMNYALQMIQVRKGKLEIVDADKVREDREGEADTVEAWRRSVVRRATSNERS